jgi:hypothetical protein
VIIRSLLATAMLSMAAATGAAPPAPDVAEEAPVTAARSPEDAPATADAEAERKICRTEKATGSLTRRTRICMTAAQWREIHDRTRRGVDEMVGSASGAPSCVSGMDVACGAPNASGPLVPTGM